MVAVALVVVAAPQTRTLLCSQPLRRRRSGATVGADEIALVVTALLQLRCPGQARPHIHMLHPGRLPLLEAPHSRTEQVALPRTLARVVTALLQFRCLGQLRTLRAARPRTSRHCPQSNRTRTRRHCCTCA